MAKTITGKRADKVTYRQLGQYACVTRASKLLDKETAAVWRYLFSPLVAVWRDGIAGDEFEGMLPEYDVPRAVARLVDVGLAQVVEEPTSWRPTPHARVYPFRMDAWPEKFFMAGLALRWPS